MAIQTVARLCSTVEIEIPIISSNCNKRICVTVTLDEKFGKNHRMSEDQMRNFLEELFQHAQLKVTYIFATMACQTGQIFSKNTKK